MLKRLELIGFKSFADKTEFTFGPGLTAIVGPNGSGKSNVVDAVRWIMGEQSAKSLRGGEMTDVIFNGSATRKALGLAEVTLVLDNTRRRLVIDADEVQVTRRVYRDGEGEYFLNRQPARLKDIKDLFLGSGAGADAYAIIAQGQVDALLHASNEERRAVFEEAAGISRFRAKKQETLRKLEQTEQNLARLRDIIEELARQLNSARQQAARARKYQELEAALKAKRIALGLQECHLLAAELRRLAGESEATRRAQAEAGAAAAESQRLVGELEARQTAHDQTLRDREAALAELRERLAGAEADLRHETQRRQNLAAELDDIDQRRERLTERLAAAEAEAAAAEAQARVTGAAAETQAAAAQALEAALHDLRAKLAATATAVERDKAELLEDMRTAARWHNDRVSLEAQSQNLRQHEQRLRARHGQASQTLTQFEQEQGALLQALDLAGRELQAARDALDALRAQLTTGQQACDDARNQMATDREARSGLASRIELLASMEASHEGASAAVKQLLDQARQHPDGPWAILLGTVAEWLHGAQPSFAGLLDLALADRADWLLVPNVDALRAALASTTAALPGRITFLPLTELDSSPLLSRSDAVLPPLELLNDSRIVPATTLVTAAQPAGTALVHWLFGDLFLVSDLDTALTLHQQWPGFRFLSNCGALVAGDGTIAWGPPSGGMGRLQRRGRLKELQDEAAALDVRIEAGEAALAAARAGVQELVERASSLELSVAAHSEHVKDLRARLVQQRERGVQVAEEVRLGHAELAQLDEELHRLGAALAQAEQGAQAADERVRKRRDAIEQGESQAGANEREQTEVQERLTAAKVAAAQTQERCRAAAERLDQLTKEVESRRRDLAQHDQRRAALERERADAETRAGELADVIACAHERRAGLECALAGLADESGSLREHRQLEQNRHLQLRQRWQELQQRLHELELRQSEAQHQLTGIALRLQEEHDVDLLPMLPAYAPPDPPLDAAAQQQEIAELRRKIARLGNVNLDSLQELAELEARAAHLKSQHDDLVAAKQALDEIIAKINADSRRLLSATFESVRGHFQDLFRKLFGGGMADIVLENPDDVLESGIEIVARPPGKEARNLSLLSGGEKSLAAVALLLAIFRDKPSPFCIMDEVDAALDEANVGRFGAVLREFLDQSQFILISHAKKTMASADVLYGVTMQEAGVSKRIAVRLEEADAAALPRAA